MNQPDNQTGQSIRRNAFILVIVLAIGFLIVHFTKAAHEHHLASDTASNAAAPPPVDVVTVKQSSDAANLTLPGETAAWYESVIYARVDGYVANWSADIGDKVKKGQVLATIETPDLDAQLAAAKAKLVAAEADAGFAKSTYARWADSPKGVVSEQEREEKKAAYDTASAQVDLDQADVNRYEALSKFKQVTAPYDGRITERKIDIGNLVTAGSNSSTTPLYRMAQNNPIRVFVDVPQSAAADMKKGVAVNITSNSLPGQTFKSAIARTADSIDAHSRTLRVEADVPNTDQALVPGMYVNVNFEIPNEGLVEVPAAALVFRNSGPQVALVDKAHHVHFQSVSIARDNGSSVEINSGVSVGDQIVLNISNQISEGATVQINKPDEDASHAQPKK